MGTNRGLFTFRKNALSLPVMMLLIFGLVAFLSLTLLGSDVAFAQTGTISGKVTSSSEPGGVSNVSVSATNTADTKVFSDATDANGNYSITVDAPDDYKVKFTDYGGDYLTEYYNNKPDFASANAISVADGGTVNNINAVLSLAPTPTVTSITPNQGKNDGVVNITNLAGSKFAIGAMVNLSRSGQPDIFATNVNVVSPSRITCDLDLAKAQPGSWDVWVTNPHDKKGVLQRAFTVTQAPGVVSPSYDFYFAEGYTGQGFQEYLTLGNPQDEVANTTITYMFPDGNTQEQQLEIPAASRTTVNVNAEVGADKEVSCKVEADQEIVVERPMYFSYQGMWAGGHDVLGAPAPALNWYFAEGYTGAGFDEWICVQNPGDDTADLTFTFQTQEAGEIIIPDISVGAHSRASFKTNDILGPDYQTSLKLESNQPIVAERPMYFNYSGTGGWGWQGGHCVMGASELSTEYYFAEGTTRQGFEEWITLQNPNQAGITVEATYQLGAGQGDPVIKTYDLAASSRFTLYAPNEIGEGKDVSVYLTSQSDFLAERPMYFNYQYNIAAQGGHCVIGSPFAATEWFLAEGYTGAGFNQWICLQNAGSEDAVVQITYYTQEAGALDPRNFMVPARTRITVMVNDDAGPNYQLSSSISSNRPIVCERPMYFVYNGLPGGHDVVGYAP
jgi:hypothetical protein